MNKNSFWGFASEHPFITAFTICTIVGGVVDIFTGGRKDKARNGLEVSITPSNKEVSK